MADTAAICKDSGVERIKPSISSRDEQVLILLNDLFIFYEFSDMIEKFKPEFEQFENGLSKDAKGLYTQAKISPEVIAIPSALSRIQKTLEATLVMIDKSDIKDNLKNDITEITKKLTEVKRIIDFIRTKTGKESDEISQPSRDIFIRVSRKHQGEENPLLTLQTVASEVVAERERTLPIFVTEKYPEVLLITRNRAQAALRQTCRENSNSSLPQERYYEVVRGDSLSLIYLNLYNGNAKEKDVNRMHGLQIGAYNNQPLYGRIKSGGITPYEEAKLRLIQPGQLLIIPTIEELENYEIKLVEPETPTVVSPPEETAFGEKTPPSTPTFFGDWRSWAGIGALVLAAGSGIAAVTFNQSSKGNDAKAGDAIYPREQRFEYLSDAESQAKKATIFSVTAGALGLIGAGLLTWRIIDFRSNQSGADVALRLFIGQGDSFGVTARGKF